MIAAVVQTRSCRTHKRNHSIYSMWDGCLTPSSMSESRFERILDRKRGKISSFQLGNVASCTMAMLENPQPITRSHPQLWSDTAAVWSFFPHSALCGGCENNLLHICRMCSLQSAREEHPEALKDAHHQYGAPSVAATVGKKLQISAQK